MARPRIVAELGRPETADEAAARKAAASQRYRSSKTFRNLIAAMIVCVAIVAVVYLGVPRGTPQESTVDLPAAAAEATTAIGHPVVVPDAPEGWRKNSAAVDGGIWRIVYAPPTGFVHVSQAVGAPDTWVAQQVGGFAPTGTVTIDGIEWDEYALPAPVAEISYALATTAGTDTILISGSMTPDTAAQAATGLGDQIRVLREDLR